MIVFEIASRHAAWLSARQEVTAANIANADTPGYKTRDVAAFESVLAHTGVELAITDRMHMAAPDGDAFRFEEIHGGSWDTAHSGNDVALESELMKVGETARQLSLDTGIVKAFHRMILASLKV